MMARVMEKMVEQLIDGYNERKIFRSLKGVFLHENISLEDNLPYLQSKVRGKEFQK